MSWCGFLLLPVVFVFVLFDGDGGGALCVCVHFVVVVVLVALFRTCRLIIIMSCTHGHPHTVFGVCISISRGCMLS